MPDIICTNCGSIIRIDPYSFPFSGDIACSRCKEQMHIEASISEGVEVKRLFPSIEELSKIWGKLSIIERQTLQESRLSFGAGAFTASEMMSLRTLEGLLRRIYNKKENLGKLIDRMEGDNDLSELGGVLKYFKDVRNRVAHPEKISSRLDAESTFSMTKRLILEIIEKKKI